MIVSWKIKRHEAKKDHPADTEIGLCFLGNMSDSNDLLVVQSLNVCDAVYAAAAVDWLRGFFLFSALKFNFSGDSQKFNMSSRLDG